MFRFDKRLYPLIEKILLLDFLLVAQVCLVFGAVNSTFLQGGFTRLVLLFWIWLLAFYLVVTLPVVLFGGYLQYRGIVGETYFGVVTWIQALFSAGIVVVYYPAIDLFGSGPPGVLGTVSLVVLPGVVVLCLFLTSSRRKLVRLASTIALGVFVLTAVWGFPGQGSVTPGNADYRQSSSGVEEPLVVIGLDGADWDYINPLIEAGRLPTLRRLRESGSWGNLGTIRPTKSPILWTTIATGARPGQHAINDFVGYRIFGSDTLFARPDLLKGTGLGVLFPFIVKGTAPLNDSHRRRFAYWDLASAVERPVSVLNWWMSWPARPLYGQMITERIHFRGFGYRRTPGERRLTHPPDLLEPALSRMRTPGEVSLEDWRRYFDITPPTYRRLTRKDFEHHQLAGEFPLLVSMLESNRRLANFLVERGNREFERQPDMMMLFRAIDLAGHMGLRYSRLTEQPPGVPDALRQKFGGFVGTVYERIDDALKDVLEKYENPNVVIVSDHGFERVREEGRVRFEHTRAPDGIWLASGPAFRSDHRGNLDLYQVLPLLLTAAGLPVAEDLPGSVPTEVFREDSNLLPYETVGSYGLRRPTRGGSGRSASGRKMKKHLEGLGYL